MYNPAFVAILQQTCVWEPHPLTQSCETMMTTESYLLKRIIVRNEYDQSAAELRKFDSN